ncbi:phosphoglycerate mutase family protein, partial [Staphylococcus aureus]|uniref:phosphoglycerate mutase family protein n=1 Tax=Staphylococcus aureus TaxID=1280 RepID=UPI0015C66416
ALLSSPVLRCRQTLLPLSDARGLPITDDARLEPDADVEVLDALLRGPLGTGAVLATHGEVLDRLLGRWSRASAVRFEGHPATGTAKGAAWFVTDLGLPHARARYLAPGSSPD